MKILFDYDSTRHHRRGEGTSSQAGRPTDLITNLPSRNPHGGFTGKDLGWRAGAIQAAQGIVDQASPCRSTVRREQRQGLVAEAAVESKVSGICCDDLCPRKLLGKQHKRAIAGIHLRISGQKFQGPRYVFLPNGMEEKASGMDSLQGGVESRPEILQQVARFPEHEFCRMAGVSTSPRTWTAPVVPLVALRKRPYNWTSVEDISNGQILHAWKDRAVRSSQCRHTWRPSRRPKIPRPPCVRLHEGIGRESGPAALLPQQIGVFRLGGDVRLLATCNTDV